MTKFYYRLTERIEHDDIKSIEADTEEQALAQLSDLIELHWGDSDSVIEINWVNADALNDDDPE